MSRFNRTNMQMVIRNGSTAVTDAHLQVMVSAIQQQVTQHVGPAWGLTCTLAFLGANDPVPAGAMVINVKDRSDEAGALGYHYTEDGLPVTYVFAIDDMADGAGLDGLSVTLSHEVIEMLVDPGVNLTAIGPDPKKHSRKVLFPYEACDPVQGNKYLVASVAVSDFIFPEWFEGDRPSGERFSQMKTLTAPFQLDKGGYASVLSMGRGQWIDRWGAARTSSPAVRHRQARREHNFKGTE